jgi:hypothetical protein
MFLKEENDEENEETSSSAAMQRVFARQAAARALRASYE